ncbi:hypothetical protein MNB_SV-6-282 [hydrothermal vent metagenome]|uniref:Uncharacterized protein n=1 Tax=hydrothermal vent metagenome TaxID=652676 RepID=A0A1W1BTB3_9ZZZZ
MTFQGHPAIKLQHLGEAEASLPEEYDFTLKKRNRHSGSLWCK